MFIFIIKINKLIKKERVNLFIVILSIAFFLITIKEGHGWGGDFAHYINLAINIATGVPYNDTGYIYNPNSSWYGPITYPPVFPLLLAVVYSIFGFDLYWMKVSIIICYFIFLLNYIVYVDNRIKNDAFKTFALITIAFSPLYWVCKNSVMSDIPFLMFLFIVINFSDAIDEIKADGRNAITYSIVIGFFCYLCYGTRSVGLLTIIAFGISQFINNKKMTIEAVMSSLVFVVLFFIQNEFIHSDMAYVEAVDSDMDTTVGDGVVSVSEKLYRFFIYLVANLTNNLPQYLLQMKWYWEGGSNSIIGIMITVLTGGMAIIGYLRYLTIKIGMAEVFLAIYSLLLLFYPFFIGSRYFIPIFPMYAVFIFYCIDRLKQHKNHVIWFSGIIIASIIFNYGIVYAKTDYGAYQTGVNTKAAEELFQYIKKNTDEKSLVIAQKPRVMALYGKVKSSTYFYGEDDLLQADKLERHMKSINATHIVISKNIWAEEEALEYIEWVRHKQNYMTKKFENEEFTVYSK